MAVKRMINIETDSTELRDTIPASPRPVTKSDYYVDTNVRSMNRQIGEMQDVVDRLEEEIAEKKNKQNEFLALEGTAIAKVLGQEISDLEREVAERKAKISELNKTVTNYSKQAPNPYDTTQAA